MDVQKGVTVVEVVVIACIVGILLLIAIPKFNEAYTRDKMWKGMSSLMTYESAQLAYLAQSNKIGPIDSLIFRPDSNEYFSWKEVSTGRYMLTAKTTIGRFKKGEWLATRIDTTGGMPKILRSCSKGDSTIVKKYLSHFFN